MTENTTKTSQKTARNHQTAPLRLYEKIFCQHCQDQEHCHTNLEHMRLCILTLIADELVRTRQHLRQRTQYQSW